MFKEHTQTAASMRPYDYAKIVLTLLLMMIPAASFFTFFKCIFSFVFVFFFLFFDSIFYVVAVRIVRIKRNEIETNANWTEQYGGDVPKALYIGSLDIFTAIWYFFGFWFVQINCLLKLLVLNVWYFTCKIWVRFTC